MWDNFYNAGVESRNTETLSHGVQTKLNTTARESVIVLHDAKSHAESSPDTEWASKIMTYVQNFHAGYKDYWTHLGSEIKNDPEGEEWKEQLRKKTMIFCSSIAGILRHPQPPLQVLLLTLNPGSRLPALPQVGAEDFHQGPGKGWGR